MKAEMSQEYREVRAFLEAFCHNYYTERDPQKVLDMVAEDVFCIGLGADEIAKDRDSFAVFMTEQMQGVPTALPYEILDYTQRPCGNRCWVCFATLEIRVITEDWGRVTYHIRMTAGIHWEQDRWLFDAIHVSEALSSQQALCFPTVQLLDESREHSSADMQRQLSKIISQLVPGGVISCYLEDGYPLALANEQILGIMGYRTYRDFHTAVEGSYLSAIHPEDRKRYIYNVRFAQETGKQCECEYRVGKAAGGYVWVHEIGRTARSDDGRQMIVSCLYDISDQMDRREKLEMETGIDALTGVFNRKGARRQLETRMKPESRWAFFVADLDNFKRVNDFYGHKQGDQILCYIADLLRDQFAQEGFVFRLGGDEFSLFLLDYGSMDSVKARLEQASMRYAELLREVCPKANSSLSIGGVYGTGLEDFQKIYEAADVNLYRIKHGLKGQVRVSPLEL